MARPMWIWKIHPAASMVGASGIGRLTGTVQKNFTGLQQ